MNESGSLANIQAPSTEEIDRPWVSTALAIISGLMIVFGLFVLVIASNDHGPSSDLGASYGFGTIIAGVFFAGISSVIWHLAKIAHYLKK